MTAALTPLDQEQRFMAHNYKPLPVVLARGKGCRVWDIQGKSYLDFLSAYSTVSAGHSNPTIIRALKRQVERLDVPSRAFYTDRLGAFAEKLTAFTGMDKMLPMNTGAEAVETAIKAARRWGYRVKKIQPDRAKILVSSGNFHGRTTTIVGFSSEPEYKRDFGPFDGGFITVPFGDTQALERAMTPDVCAYLTEPMQGEAGIIIPPAGWLREVQAICKRHNVLLIVDEIQSGMGRTGKDFAFQHEIDRPDGLILGKALGGGVYPVSAFLARADVMDVFEPGSHGSTFGGNPIAAAIGCAALDLLRDQALAQRSADLGAYLLGRLKTLTHPAIRDIRGAGLWIGIDFDPAILNARALCEDLMKRGVLCKETHQTVVRLAPPLVITKREVDWAFTRISEALDAVPAARAA